MLVYNSFKTITICTSDSSLVSVSKTVFLQRNQSGFIPSRDTLKTYDTVGAFWILEDIIHIARDF